MLRADVRLALARLAASAVVDVELINRPQNGDRQADARLFGAQSLCYRVIADELSSIGPSCDMRGAA